MEVLGWRDDGEEESLCDSESTIDLEEYSPQGNLAMETRVGVEGENRKEYHPRIPFIFCSCGFSDGVRSIALKHVALQLESLPTIRTATSCAVNLGTTFGWIKRRWLRWLMTADLTARPWESHTLCP